MKCFWTIFIVTLMVLQSCSKETETCTKKDCVCEKGYVLSSNNKDCLPYVTDYNGECSEDAQCEFFGENIECNYVCKCKKGYRWYQGRCLPFVGLGEKCTKTEDCFDGYNLQSLSCENGVCGCSDGYYRRGNTDCRKIASKENDICALTIDCQVPNLETICKIGKCTKPSTDIEKVIDEEIFFSDFAKSQINCTTNDDCKDTENAECYDKTGTCVCKKPYFFDSDGSCIAELGVNVECSKDADCPIKPGKCENGICYCRDYYFVEEGNRKCIKSMSESNDNCLSNEWCLAYGSYSYCNSSEKCQCSHVADYNNETRTCIKTRDPDPDMCTSDYECTNIQNGYCIDEKCGCKKHYVLQNNKCVPDIGAPCDDKILCEIENSECRNDTCQCLDNYVNYDYKACYLISDLGGECEVDVQCSETVRNSVCMNNKCECDEKYEEHNHKCYETKTYGSYCNNQEECFAVVSTFGEKIVCRNFKCQCPTNYSLKDNTCSFGNVVIGNFFIILIFSLTSIIIYLK